MHAACHIIPRLGAFTSMLVSYYTNFLFKVVWNAACRMISRLDVWYKHARFILLKGIKSANCSTWNR